MKKYTLYLALFLLPVSLCLAETSTTTNPEGTTTTEETTTAEPSSTTSSGPKLIGPTGATGVIRRADRRQDRRFEDDLKDLGDVDDLEDLNDAIDRRPVNRRR